MYNDEKNSRGILNQTKSWDIFATVALPHLFVHNLTTSDRAKRGKIFSWEANNQIWRTKFSRNLWKLRNSSERIVLALFAIFWVFWTKILWFVCQTLLFPFMCLTFSYSVYKYISLLTTSGEKYFTYTIQYHSMVLELTVCTSFHF